GGTRSGCSIAGRGSARPRRCRRRGGSEHAGTTVGPASPAGPTRPATVGRRVCGRAPGRFYNESGTTPRAGPQPMTTAAQTKHSASPDKLRRSRPLVPWLTHYLDSSVGGKHLVALSGAVLVGFVIVHMAGNLQILLGREAFTHSAHTPESQPALAWTARLVLLPAFVLHIVLALRLAVRNRAARPTPYAHEDTAQASWASRHMVLTGLLLFVFVVYHL